MPFQKGSSQPPFALDPGNGFGSRLMNLDLFVNQSSSSGRTVEAQASVAGRNTEYGYDPTVCNGIPPP